MTETVTVWCPKKGCPRRAKNARDATMHPDTVSIEVPCPWHSQPGNWEDGVERNADGQVVLLIDTAVP